MTHRVLARRLRALEVFSSRTTDLPAFVVCTVFDARLRGNEREHAPIDGDTVRVAGQAVHRAPGETDDALYLRAARLHPAFGSAEAVPVLMHANGRKSEALA